MATLDCAPDALLSCGALQAGFALYLGLIVGGFLTVLTWRLRGSARLGFRAALRTLSEPGSQCPACGRRLGWLEKFPLIGYACSLGRCRGCRTVIPARYPLMEALVAAMVVVIALPGLGGPGGWVRVGLAGALALLAGISTVRPRAAAAGAWGLAVCAIAVAWVSGNGVPVGLVAAAAGLLLACQLLEASGPALGIAALSLAAAPWAGPFVLASGLAGAGLGAVARRWACPTPLLFLGGASLCAGWFALAS